MGYQVLGMIKTFTVPPETLETIPPHSPKILSAPDDAVAAQMTEHKSPVEALFFLSLSNLLKI